MVRRLSDVRLADANKVGRKAASLGELIAAGVRVPDGVVIPAGAVPDAGRDLPDGAWNLGPGPFAVRSSGVSEDGAAASFAGMFETVLDVSREGLVDATRRVLDSAHSAKLSGYAAGPDGRMAVIVQDMVDAAASGVALTADPISGDRGTCVVTAVSGLGDRLVSGEAPGDEWSVVGGVSSARRISEAAVDAAEVSEVARQARAIADARGVPQDIEWAIDRDGALWILQARPMTALPPEVSWAPPTPGTFTRQYRIGEWIGQPVTPLFESWLLTMMEERMHAFFFEQLGQGAPRPLHVVVNGWYFYSMNWATPGAIFRNLPRMLWRLARNPRAVAGVNPSTVGYSFPLLERMWNADFRTHYLAAIERASVRVEEAPVDQLPALVDELAELAGEAFGWLAALSGAAYKMELNLARFYGRHLRPTLGGSHLPLLAGFALPATGSAQAVTSLDWFYPMAPASFPPPADVARLVEVRHSAEEAAFGALSSSPRRLAAFRRLLAGAQHLVPVRAEQVAELTTPWPIMRRAVLRMGEALVAGGAIGTAEDIFFLTRTEALGVLNGGHLDPAVDVAGRRALRDEQARLVAPLIIGRVNPILARLFASYARTVGAVPSTSALVKGTPASPGRAGGVVRVIHAPDEFDMLQPGEILVAPTTAPAWTPLFGRAAAVVTDVGSAAAHASIIAREFGIPAVVGCGDATARLRTGMRVMVDGGTGNVEPG